MSTARYPDLPAVADRVRASLDDVVTGTWGRFEQVRTPVVGIVSRWLDSMAAGLDGMLKEL